LWPALTLAVQNHWGGPDSEDKRDWFAGVIVDLFPDFTKQKPQASNPIATAPNTTAGSSAEEPDSADVEAVLLQVMLDEFEVNVDDDSSFETADQIIRLRNDIAKGKSGEYDGLERRWRSKSGARVENLFKKGDDEEQETDWDSDEDEDEDQDADDVAMTDAPEPPREKQPPEVDEEGFTKVTKKKR
jgi:pre-rRNA-processing protein TSR2